jgi:hypothetical protein
MRSTIAFSWLCAVVYSTSMEEASSAMVVILANRCESARP